MHRLTVLPGDGIGPEVVREAIEVLNTVASKFNLEFETEEALMGGCAIDAAGTPLPETTLELCRTGDAVLLGAIGGPKWDTTDPDKPRPEQGLLGLRKGLELFANLRPVKVFDALIESSTLKPEVIHDVDLVVVRELTGGLYFGASAREGDRAYDTLDYQAYEVERLMKVAFELAEKRRGVVHSVDKANVLESSRLWRQTAGATGAGYPDVELNHMLVDNCAMQLIRNPKQFDVIATENLFGDILSDEASMLTGSLGMLASASLGERYPGLYEPIHGSAPDIAGQDVANPIATILSVALMLRYSFDLETPALAIEGAVEAVLAGGFRTADIMSEGKTMVGTVQMGDVIRRAIEG
ncbi:MAG: 3-isopropylmalate dehydrogenase [Actinomycetota bacterium]|nr:3-isopropylmalate dehydrogenase [Actinomycetota bacterium]